jgi:hypothetical protein
MGSIHAIELASGEFVNSIEQQLTIHLTSNCYPPVPLIMLPVAIASINAINEGDYDRLIDLPEKVKTREGRTDMIASQIIESLRLDAWCNSEEGE